jgi:putative YphP/YqiW family bacilliredoxin
MPYWLVQWKKRLVFNLLPNFAFLIQQKLIKNMYPAEIVFPMKEELTENGFNELLSPEDVDSQLKQEGTTLVVVNSVCGCSAGTARPGVLMAVTNATKKPDFLATSFAGFDIDAVKKLREHLLPYPPSSPSIALFKNGELVHFIERHMIEGRSAQMIAHNLIAAFEEYC